MTYYNKTYFGPDLKIAEKQNLLDVGAELVKAKQSGDYFVLISSSEVFDRGVKREYFEEDSPNSSSLCARYLIQAEQVVLQYPMGVVIRVQDVLSDLTPIFESIASLQDPVFPSESYAPLGDDVSKAMIDFVVFNGEPRIAHVCSSVAMDLSCIWFAMRQRECVISDSDRKCSARAYKGKMSSSFFSDKLFYKELMEKNRRDIVRHLAKLGEKYERLV